MADVIVHDDERDARFLYLSGPNGRPIPRAVRARIKAPPYLADWLPAEKLWRLPAAAAARLVDDLAAEGWHVTTASQARRQPPPDPGRPSPWDECRTCGQPYRPGAVPTGAPCRRCGQPLVLVPPPSLAHPHPTERNHHP